MIESNRKWPRIIQNDSKKSIIMIANSSWYLLHYRSFLISEIRKSNQKIFALAPKDKFSVKLSELCEFIEWKVSTKNSLNIFSLLQPFLSLLEIIYNLKPNTIHSHTIKPNLLVSVITYILNIKTVLSFTGLGTLSKRKGFQKFLFLLILRTIYYFSISEIKGLNFFSKNYRRTTFIFQNQMDKKLFENLFKTKNNNINSLLIPGSGLPDIYQKSQNSNKTRFNNSSTKNNFNFLFCARLLKSKGIEDFLNLSKFFPESLFYVYGEIYPNSNDSITDKEILEFKRIFKNVRFMGFIENPLFQHLKDKSILIVPSNYGEGFPRAILEAISLEIPVIASKNACSSNFTEREVFVARDNDVQSLIYEIKKIKKLIKKNKLVGFLKNSRDLVLNKFTEEIIVKNTIKVYEQNY